MYGKKKAKLLGGEKAKYTFWDSYTTYKVIYDHFKVDCSWVWDVCYNPDVGISSQLPDFTNTFLSTYSYTHSLLTIYEFVHAIAAELSGYDRVRRTGKWAFTYYLVLYRKSLQSQL